MTAPSEPGRPHFQPLLRLLPFLLAYRARIAAALVALAVASVATLVIPVAARRIVDHGFTAQNAALVNQYFIFMFLVVFALALGSALRQYYVTWLGERVVADIRDALFRHLTTLTPAFFETQKTGNVVSRLTADTTLIKSAFSSTASIALRNIVMLGGALAMMIYTSPGMSGLAALAIPLIVLPLRFYGRKVRGLSRLAQDTLAESAAFAQERLAGIAAIQSNTQELSTVANFMKANEAVFNAARTRTFARSFLVFGVILVGFGAIVCLLWFGAQQVLTGQMSGGTLTQFLIYAILGASSLSQLSEVWSELQQAAGAAERIGELMAEKPEIASPAEPTPLPPALRGEVAFDHVDFTYAANAKTRVLHNVSFAAKPGEVVAVVGPSGAGKTTLYALLQRFREPDSGKITLDGINISEFALEDLRGAIATVPQDATIFSGTIADNIRFGRPEASDAEVEAAAKAARVAEFVEKLPLKYNSILGERGITLSGGQRQRLAIARAILRDAPVLLLDEATSALDAESEALIQEALETISKGRTTLVIAHRLATVRHADKIIVLDQGKIIAQGTHAQLLKKSPLYARLAKLQFSA
ncbi:ABC transporter transmembrane domain-containing protein [Aestuariivirga litoralis]|uniref:ABC transporter transmembrane domain-containing protein n=1 Tax=Aestuariivirga litoralis TaxID=2650924 RepID=UPI0018C7AAF0|nr:ABC transporter transmembrane domain-containing protein [Aestuariivirga litoralis]MBG1233116.1 ATP-binding cassette domain-containing protein [Aestuariivirga litoralis]